MTRFGSINLYAAAKGARAVRLGTTTARTTLPHVNFSSTAKLHLTKTSDNNIDSAKSPSKGKNKGSTALSSEPRNGEGSTETVIDFAKFKEDQTFTKKLTPSQKRKQAAQLARTSISDIFDFLATQSPEEVNFKEPVDIGRVLASPSQFKKLSFNQKETVIEEIDPYRYEEWGTVSRDVKRLMYYISYGNWGPRDEFRDPIATAEGSGKPYVPEDVPFPVTDKQGQHSKVAPRPDTPVKKLPAVNLMLATPERTKRFNAMVKKLDPVSQTVVIFAFLITALAIARDKFSSEEEQDEKHDKGYTLETGAIGDILENTECVGWISDVEKKKHAKDATGAVSLRGLSDTERRVLEVAMPVHEGEKEEQQSSGKKWYYLWLK